MEVIDGLHQLASDEPEDQFRNAPDKETRSALRCAVIRKYREQVRDLARRALPAFVPEAVQCGVLGLLVALEKYEPKAAIVNGEVQPITGDAFWSYARSVVQFEIALFRDKGFYCPVVPLDEYRAARLARDTIPCPPPDGCVS